MTRRLNLPPKKGFTLIELLVTLSIMGILSAMLFPYMQRYQDRAKTTATWRNLELMQSAVMRYAQMNEEFIPTSWGGSNTIAGASWIYDTNTNMLNEVAWCATVGETYGNQIVNDITQTGSNQTLKPSSEIFQANSIFFYRTGPITNMNFWPTFYRIAGTTNYVDRKGNLTNTNLATDGHYITNTLFR